MKKRFLFLFLLLVALTLAFYGCNDKQPEEEMPTVEDTSVRYSSMKGDVLVLDGENFELTLADGSGTFSGSFIGNGKALILTTEEDEFYISLDEGRLFSFISMRGSHEGDGTGRKEVCAHPNKAIRNQVEPTCTESGYSGDEYCVLCGEVLQTGAVMPPKGHFFTKESDVVCERGYCTRNETRFYACSVCGAIGTETYEVPNSASGQHSYTAISSVVAKEATCAENQLNYAACSVCGEVSHIATLEVPNTATGRHDFSKPSTKKMYQEADCGHNAKYYYECSVCGLVSINPDDTYEVPNTATGTHDFSQPSGVTKTEATCVSDRVEYARCSVCGVIDTNYSVVIEGTATGRHMFTALSDEEAAKATCTQDRLVYSKCAYCGLINRMRVFGVAATATGHTYVDHICTDCGQAESECWAKYDVSLDKNVDRVEAYLYKRDYKYDLLIYGTGNMESYSALSDRPWKDQAEIIQNVIVYGKIDKIGDYAFAGGTELETVKFLPSRISEKPADFDSDYGKYYKLASNGTYTKNDSDVWDDEQKYGELTVKRIGHYAFYGCSLLERLTLPKASFLA